MLTRIFSFMRGKKESDEVPKEMDFNELFPELLLSASELEEFLSRFFDPLSDGEKIEFLENFGLGGEPKFRLALESFQKLYNRLWALSGEDTRARRLAILIAGIHQTAVSVNEARTIAKKVLTVKDFKVDSS